MKRYFYGLLARYLGYYVPQSETVVEVRPRSTLLAAALAPRAVVAVDAPTWPLDRQVSWSALAEAPPRWLALNGSLHFEDDVQELLERLHRICRPETRLLITYYSSLWKPIFRLAARLGWANTGPDQNWLAHADIRTLLHLAGFELIATSPRVLVPVPIPLVSEMVNRWLAPLPVVRWFTMANVAVARPHLAEALPAAPSVTIVVPARNECGTLDQVLRRVPSMGPRDEIIFVEGHSTDDTWNEMLRLAAADPDRIRCFQQSGHGKGDAVRLGFSQARGEVLMILDADLSVAPETLPKFYRALTSGMGEFINGSRLVYPMERRAMRFANMVGNKFFAVAFSFLLGQPLKDTLCGTKVLSRTAYERIAGERAFFGDFDPFGDFDLLFGAARLGLKIVELPVRYGERQYGETNIRRWRHGWLLLHMTWFAARRMRFL